MKRKTPLLLLLAIGLIAGITACDGKDSDSAEPEQEVVADEQPTAPKTVPENSETFVEFLTNGDKKVWAASSFTIGGMNNSQACRLDDSMEFNVDGTYVYDGGKTLCGAEDDTMIKSGVWEFSDDNSELIFDAGTNNEVIADVMGFTNDRIALGGSYLGFDLMGLYVSN